MESVGIVVVIGVIVLAVVLNIIQRARRKGSPVVGQWDGHLVAVDILITPGTMRHQPGTDSQFSTPILRMTDGREVEGHGSDPSRLPVKVRQQIYRPWWVVNENNPNFNLPKAERRDAQHRARNGGHRFALPRPLPVVVRENERGEVLWDLL